MTRVSVRPMSIPWLAAGSASSRYCPEQPGEAACRSCGPQHAGALRVTNQLRVLPSPRRPDADTQYRAQVALRQDAYTETLPISVRVIASKATIEGRARTAFERGHATKLIASVEGVRDIDNQIVVSVPPMAHRLNGRRGSESFVGRVRPREEDPEIAEAVRRRLRHGRLGAEVSAEVDRGVATLNGIVQTTSDRISANLCAYEAGALFVDNRIRVRDLD